MKKATRATNPVPAHIQRSLDLCSESLTKDIGAMAEIFYSNRLQSEHPSIRQRINAAQEAIEALDSELKKISRSV